MFINCKVTKMFKWLYNKIKSFYDNEYSYEVEFEISIYDVFFVVLLIFLAVKLWI